MRFNYEQEWNSEILNNLCQFYKGNGLSKNDLSDSGYSCILYGQLYTTYLNEVITSTVSKTNAKLDNPFYAKRNDLIIPSSGEDPIDIAVARSLQVDNVLLGGDLNVLRPKSILNSSFLSYQLNGKRKVDIAKIAQGKSIVHLHNCDLKRIKINYPCIEEQNKIANLLFQLDKLIETQIKIIEDYIYLNKCIINELIINLEEYTECYISDIAKIGRGRVISSKEINKQLKPIYPVYSSQTSKNGIMGYLDQYEFDGEYITWTTDGANAGTVYYRNGKFNCTNVCGTLKINKENDTFFVSKVLSCTTSSYVSKNLANPKLMNNVMAKIKIKLPSLDKQREFSKIIKSIEKKIKYEKDLLDLLKSQKNYFLKNLFI